MDDILFQIFVTILGVLFLTACVIGVVALYFALKGWILEEFEIEIPPKSEKSSSD